MELKVTGKNVLYETPSSYRINVYIYVNKVFLHVFILHHHILDCMGNNRRLKSSLKVFAEKYLFVFSGPNISRVLLGLV